jgi:hypothetical protein
LYSALATAVRCGKLAGIAATLIVPLVLAPPGIRAQTSPPGAGKENLPPIVVTRLECVAQERGGVLQRDTHCRFIAFRSNESVDETTQPFSVVCRHSSLCVGRGSLLLVREVLIERTDAYAGLLSYPRCGEALGSFRRQNLNSSFQNGSDELRSNAPAWAVFVRKSGLFDERSWRSPLMPMVLRLLHAP